MKKKSIAVGLMLFVLCIGFIIDGQERSITTELETLDVVNRVVMMGVVGFVLKVTGEVGMMLGAISLVLYFRMRRIEKDIQLLRKELVRQEEMRR